MSAGSYLRHEAHLLETSEGESVENYRTPLGVLKKRWQKEFPAGSLSDCYFHKRVIGTRLLLLEAGVPENRRYDVLSSLFGRTITSTNDLKLSEAVALSRYARKPRDPNDPHAPHELQSEFIQLVKELLEVELELT